jgi:RecB family exonuclease
VALQLDLFGPGGPGNDGAAGGAVAPAGGEAGGSPLAAPGVVVTRGALAAEAALLAMLDELTAEARRDPVRLATPVRVVAPSRSLRRHLAARLVQPGRAIAGVAVQTLHGLACEVLERAGIAVPRGALLFETLVEREARREPLLHRGLGDLVDGFLAVAPAVADLLDAGFEPEHAEAADDALASDGPRAAGRAELERARALVRVAARTELRLRELGMGRRSTLLRLAADALAPAPERVLPARAVLLYGFVAASGVAADLLMALLRWRGATLLADRPPVPGMGAGSEAAAARRLAERACGVAGPPRPWPPPAVGGPDGSPAASPSPDGSPAPSPDGWPGASPVTPVPVLSAFTAFGAEAEAREVARRLRRLLDGGGREMRPEGLAIVARDFGPYRLALRRHLRRLGVPFSGVGERGALLPGGRRASAVLDLLRWGPEVAADRWLDACASLPAELRVDLRLALRALGAARLRDVAALRGKAFAGGVALPVRQGLATAPAGWARQARPAEEEPATAPPAPADPPEVAPPVDDDDDDDGEGRAVARARRISGDRLRQGVLLAVGLHDRLQAWPRLAAAAHLDWLRGLLADLGLDGDPAEPLAAAMAELQRELPGELELSSEELRLLLARALGDGGRCAMGGEGGGVQVLSVAEARGRTFEHLFLLGLNRGAFPRPLPEDPLLPDGVRQVLLPLLPDLPLARDGFDDERHAFAQLLSAAPAVCLSWCVADDDGKPLAASPLVERLMPLLAPRPAPPLYPSAAAAASPAAGPAAGPSAGGGAGESRSRDGGEAGSEEGSKIGSRERAEAASREHGEARPADEFAVLAGLQGSRHDLGRVLPIALREVRGELGRPLLDLDVEAVAAARVRILDELDPDLRTAAGRAAAARLGPYFGFTGERPLGRGHPIYVTHLEALVACPWQLFLGRVLRIERPPDPLGALPGADPLRLGSLVHRVLDRLVKRALARGGQQPAPPAAVAVPWPAAEEIEALLLEAAAEMLAEEGLALPGLARSLASHARPFVEAARELDWSAPGGAVPVLASEVEGELPLPAARGAVRRLRFRADREDLVNGWRRFTDYKTGRPLSEARDAAQRRRQLLADIRTGKRLQAVAYVMSAGVETAIGRYLFLRPDLAPAAREVTVEAGDGEARAAFAAAVGAAVGAWDAGSFFPRLVDPAGRREPSRCSLCAVAEACLRGDSGARRRLHEWAARARAAAPPGDPAEAALLAVWELPAAAGEAPAEVDAAAALDPEGAGE